MRIKSLFTILFVTGTIFLSSCDNDNGVSQKEIDPIENFTFSTTKTVQLVVNIADNYQNQYFYKVEVFDRNPFATDTLAQLLTAGVAKGNSALNTSVVIPQHITQLYIRQTDPLQRQTVKFIEVADNMSSLSCNFNIEQSAAIKSKVKQLAMAADPKATDYPLPSTYQTISSGSIKLSGSNYYLPAGVISSAVSFESKSKSALYVAGNLTIGSDNYIPSKCLLVILPGGKVTYNSQVNFEQTDVVVAVHPGATLLLNQASSVGQSAKLINDGTTTCNAPLEVRSNSGLINNGTLTGTKLTQTNSSTFTNNQNAVFSNFIMNSNSTFINNGVFEAKIEITTNNKTAIITNNNSIITGFFNMLNGGGELINNCKVECGDFGLEGGLITSKSGSVISCKSLYANNTSFNLNGNAILKTGAGIQDAAQSITNGVTFNHGVTITGQADGNNIPLVSILKLNQKTGWKVLTLNGTMEYSLAKGETPNSNFYKNIYKNVSIVQSPSITINGTSCNGGGVNADTGSNAPADPIFPVLVEENNEYTFTMEDLWPSLGDYDMNDIVFSIKNIKKNIDKNNKVVSMSFDITPRAAGSTRKICPAVQFDKVLSDNLSFTSTYTKAYKESGQQAANIILFPEFHSLFGKSSPVVLNTFANLPEIKANDYTFTVNFNTPTDNSDVIISNLNFYVIIGDVENNDRKEVHLSGFKATNKVQMAVNNYKDSNNMVWALMLPVGDFKYPTEMTKISVAYPKFDTWASSGGVVNTDWYLFPSTTKNLVYTK